MTLSPRVNCAVVDELEQLSSSGNLLAANGPNATMRLPTRERDDRRLRFVGAYFARQTDVERDGAAAIVTAGPPGAGKSTALAGLPGLPPHCREIDADLIKEVMFEEDLQSGRWDSLLELTLSDGRPVQPMELASLIQQESIEVFDTVLTEAFRRGENLLVHGTLRWDGQPHALLELLRAQSYEELTIVDVEVSAARAVQQSRERWWRDRISGDRPLGGRFVPRVLIEQLYAADGVSICARNATTMYELSDLPSTALLRRASSDSGLVDLDLRKA